MELSTNTFTSLAAVICTDKDAEELGTTPLDINISDLVRAGKEGEAEAKFTATDLHSSDNSWADDLCVVLCPTALPIPPSAKAHSGHSITDAIPDDADDE